MSKELAQELDPIEPEQEEAPVEAEKVEPEKAEPEAVEEEKPQKSDKTVPLAALHEERQKRKELQQQLQAAQQAQEQRQALLERRLQEIQQAAWQAQQPKPPSFDEDPIAAMKHGVEMTQAEIAQIREHQRREYEAQQRAMQEQQFRSQLESVVAQDISEFTQEQPDYLDAINDLRQRRAKQHQALGATPQQAIQMVMQEEYQLAAAALQNGKSPARAAYEIAQAYGYAPKKAEPAPVEQKMETLQKGAKAASSLGNGGTPTGKLTVDAVANMDDEEFHEFIKSGGWAKLG